MPADKPAKLPPVRVARAVDTVRRRMRCVEQRMMPAPAAVLDLMTGRGCYGRSTPPPSSASRMY